MPSGGPRRASEEVGTTQIGGPERHRTHCRIDAPSEQPARIVRPRVEYGESHDQKRHDRVGNAPGQQQNTVITFAAEMLNYHVDLSGQEGRTEACGCSPSYDRRTGSHASSVLSLRLATGSGP